MTITEVLHPRSRELRDNELPVAEIRESLGEAAVARMLINNQEGAPTELDPITGKPRTFARLNHELAMRNGRIGLYPDSADRLPVDGLADLETLEKMYPEDVFEFSKR